VNPPTYKGGFEKFYLTDGRLTWAEPPYDVIDAATDVRKMMERMEGAKALILVQEQKPPGGASHAVPLYARHLSRGQYVYYLSNRPDEVFEITGGPKVKPRSMQDIGPLENHPQIPRGYKPTERSTVEVVPITQNQAAYYKDLWLHRIAGSDGSYNLAVLLDGFVAGIIGYSIDPMARPYSGVPPERRDAMLLRFAIGAPHLTLRLTRLTTMVSFQRKAMSLALGPKAQIWLAMAGRILTVEMTRHPEAKGLRGLMKMVVRHKDGKDGWRLIYEADLGDRSYDDCLQEWLKKEEQWQTSRKKSASPESKSGTEPSPREPIASPAP
jgi:hypothetical protein